jgi:hypothetical protein
MDETPNLKLPYLIAAQAQKHVTHNEALRALDALVQLSVLDRDVTEPPAAPVDGDRYIVAASATGAWAGHDSEIAVFQDNAWEFHQPREGWLSWVADEIKLYAFDGNGWIAYTSGNNSVNPAPFVGVNTTADATNRLAVKSDAVLFSHDDVTPGNGSLQLKLNKETPTKTSSVLFQNGYAGHAELGLCGDDNWHLKMSADGANWREAIIAKWGTPASIQLQVGDLPTGQQGGTALHLGTSLGVSFMAEYTGPLGTAGGAGIVGAVTTTPAGGDQRLGYFLLGSRNGSTGISNQAGMVAFSAGAWTAGASHPSYLQLVTTQSGTPTRTPRYRIEEAGNLRPETDNAYDIGSPGYRVAHLYLANAPIVTSDARDKEVVGDLDFAGMMIDAIDPKLFRWRVGGNELRPSETETAETEDGTRFPRMDIVARAGIRTHAGFIAQEVKAAMDAVGVDFAAWGLDDRADPTSRQWLSPEQLIPVLWAALRETRAEIAELRRTAR